MRMVEPLLRGTLFVILQNITLALVATICIRMIVFAKVAQIKAHDNHGIRPILDRGCLVSRECT